jgi:transposase InsO family protein
VALIFDVSDSGGGVSQIELVALQCLGARRKRQRQKLVSTGSDSTALISSALQGWATQRGIRIDYIQPGNLQQNAYIERDNRTMRYEWLAQHLFDSIHDVQAFATQWLWSYNHERPNMSIGGITPKQKLAMAA